MQIANSQVVGEEEEEDLTAEEGQCEEDEEGRDETEGADDAALLMAKSRIRAEETVPMPVSCSDEKILLARLLGISTNKGNKISLSGDNVLPDSIPSSTSPTSRPQAPRKLAAGIAEMCAASCNSVQILFGVLSSCGPGVGPKVRAVLFSLEL